MKQSTRGPNDLEERIEYLTNQNEFLKKKLRESVDKNKILEEEYDKLLEENNNFRLVRNQGKDPVISSEDIAYIAGLFDGEGSIHFKRTVQKKRKNTKVKVIVRRMV